jgi:fatty acid desaturase
MSPYPELPAGGDPRRRRIVPGWLIILVALLALLVYGGWIPVLMVIAGVLCVGFLLNQQKRDERRRDNAARSTASRRD